MDYSNISKDITTPEYHGFKTWTYHPSRGTSTTTPTSNLLYSSRIWIPYDFTAANIWYNVATVGTSPANVFFSLYTIGGTRLGTTADQSTAVQTTGSKSPSITVASGQSLALSVGWYWVSTVFGTTSSAALRSNVSAATTNANLTGAALIGASNGTITPPPPDTITPSSGTSNVHYWFALA